MQTVRIEVSQNELIRWVRQLSPAAKRSVLKALIPRLDRVERLVDYGEQRMRELCAGRGLDWDALNEDERARLVDALLHETP